VNIAPADAVLVWRSLLFVPANNPRFVDKAHTRGADGIILDLEDSVPAAERPAARERLMESAAAAARRGADILVRMNAEAHEAEADLDAAVHPGVTALMVPKVEDAESLRALSEQVSRLESARGIAPGSVRFLILIESAAGLLRAEAIARADPRSVALDLGAEDFAVSTGMVPEPEPLMVPKQLALLAARAAGLMPFGTLSSVAAYQDLAAYRDIALRSRRFGFEGASCIHPSVVPILNEAFTPTPAEAENARRVVETYEQAQRDGSGAISLDGKMVDVPVAVRARKLLARLDVIHAREVAIHPDGP
jgi:citrate lyase subunit beta/citryl-CoA lyase